MKYEVYNSKAEKVKQIDLNSDIFGVDVNEGLVHQAVVAQMANSRQVLAHAKDRSEVRGGGKKPWRQKGTGRARHGSIRSPLWKGGGVTFGPTKERNFTKKINKKMKRKALFICLSDRVNDKDLVLLDKLEIKEDKTREFVELLKNLKGILGLKEISKKKPKTENKKKEEKKQDKQQVKEDKKKKKFDIKDYKISILVVSGKNTAKLSKITRNIPGVKVLGANSLNVVDILGHKNLLLTEDSLKILEEVYLKDKK